MAIPKTGEVAETIKNWQDRWSLKAKVDRTIERLKVLEHEYEIPDTLKTKEGYLEAKGVQLDARQRAEAARKWLEEANSATTPEQVQKALQADPVSLPHDPNPPPGADVLEKRWKEEWERARRSDPAREQFGDSLDDDRGGGGDRASTPQAGRVTAREPDETVDAVEPERTQSSQPAPEETQTSQPAPEETQTSQPAPEETQSSHPAPEETQTAPAPADTAEGADTEKSIHPGDPASSPPPPSAPPSEPPPAPPSATPSEPPGAPPSGPPPDAPPVPPTEGPPAPASGPPAAPPPAPEPPAPTAPPGTAPSLPPSPPPPTGPPGGSSALPPPTGPPISPGSAPGLPPPVGPPVAPPEASFPLAPVVVAGGTAAGGWLVAKGPGKWIAGAVIAAITLVVVGTVIKLATGGSTDPGAGTKPVGNARSPIPPAEGRVLTQGRFDDKALLVDPGEQVTINEVDIAFPAAGGPVVEGSGAKLVIDGFPLGKVVFQIASGFTCGFLAPAAPGCENLPDPPPELANCLGQFVLDATMTGTFDAGGTLRGEAVAKFKLVADEGCPKDVKGEGSNLGPPSTLPWTATFDGKTLTGTMGEGKDAIPFTAVVK